MESAIATSTTQPTPGTTATVSSESPNNHSPEAQIESEVTPESTSSEAPSMAGAAAFASSVFSGGFAPPKINTSAFFSSVQGKIQSTLSQAKSPTLNIQAPQININQIQASTGQLANTTKDWGFSAFKTLSSAAQRVSSNVTEGIQKEHQEFLKQKKMETVIPHEGTESVPAWAGLPDEDQIKSRILSLSKDKRNFLLPPPPGTDFVFDMKAYSTTAMETLRQDPNLDKMRFYLVPKEVEELVFWRNYFYRVSLLKQVSLASASSEDTDENTLDPDGNLNHRRSLSVSSALGYNIYFGKDDVEGPPNRSGSNSTTVKELGIPSKETKSAKKADKKPDILFEAELPDNEEDTDAWLEKQLASEVPSGDGDDDGADVEVQDWVKELQNELKDYDDES